MATNSKLKISAVLFVFGGWVAACGSDVVGDGGAPLGGGGEDAGGSTATGGGSGGGAPCVVAADCPPSASECVIPTCEQGACGMAPAPSGMITAEQTKGDCRVNKCKNGVVFSFGDDTDTPNDADVNDCSITTCTNGTPTVLSVAPGTPCAQGGGKVCVEGACVECIDDSQCPGALCKLNQCVADPCTNGLKDPGETDVDCGGSCAAKCGPGKACAGDTDCEGGSCSAAKCAPTCSDHVTNAGETDVDCGGPCAAKCGPAKSCVANTDCASALCDAATLTCASSCNDAFKGGDETDVDCGGSTCPACAVGASCGADADCTSTVCAAGSCALLNGCDPAAATDLTGQDPVTVTFDAAVYAPPCIRVSQGTKVVFSGSFAVHPLAGGKIIGGAKFPDPASPFMPITSNGMNKTFTLLSAGSFPYYCDTDPTMFGAVFVQ